MFDIEVSVLGDADPNAAVNFEIYLSCINFAVKYLW